tara:strand:- start:338 stop:829 length:492 start_codon:yes stop_codon:yes gene_type:complete
MHIKLINKNLYLNDYKLKCAVGKRGITSKKREGDKKTPKGSFKFVSLFYRKDRIKKIKSNLKKYVIKKNMGWCDDPYSKYYNKLIRFPFKFGAEKLYLRKNIYDIILILNFNLNPVVKNKGSAIFLHISSKNYTPTNGCIAVSLKDMKLLLKKINKKTSLTIF